jgi:alkaline phosphatase
MRRYLQFWVHVIAITLALQSTFPVASSSQEVVCETIYTAKNIIFMVPDGMGLSNVTAARIFKNGPNGDPLYLETLPKIGYQRTHSANSTVTDSAAAASAWATGEKFNNGEVSCHTGGDCDSLTLPTMFERAKRKGKSTGLVVTSTITHATPAAWGAHVHSRECETEIGRQYVEVTGVNVMLGGGIGTNTSLSCSMYPGQIISEVIASAQSKGYVYVTTKSEMKAAVAAQKKKILGLFTPEGKTPERFRINPTQTYPYDEPTLSEMTATALDILEEDKDGFFLLLEGSQIDWANHANDLTYQLSEILAFDEAVKVVLDWIKARPLRESNTLVIIVADHDCSGFAVNRPLGTLSQTGDLVEAGWTSTDHTGEDTIIWSQGPGSNCLRKPLNNTDLYWVMKKVLK